MGDGASVARSACELTKPRHQPVSDWRVGEPASELHPPHLGIRRSLKASR